jgi:predicted Rossmann fold nucleotide-binding protein DprA/Smf involved in DNA uptake
VRSATDVLDAIGEIRLGLRRNPQTPGASGQGRTSAAPAAQPGQRSAPIAREALRAGQARQAQRPAGTPLGERHDPRAAVVMASLGWEPTSLNRVVARAALPVADVVAVLEQLAAIGSVTEERGWWQRLR